MSESLMPAPQNTAPLRAVTSDERACYQRDGVVHLAGIYPVDWVGYLKSQLVDIFDRQTTRSTDQRSVTGESTEGTRVDMVALVERLRKQRPDATVALDGDDAEDLRGRSLVETDAAFWHPGMRHHNIAGPLPEIVANLTDSEQVNFYSDQLFLKEAGSRIRTPFHQDKPYFMIDGGDVAVCWVPVDTVTAENGPMGYVLGSHLWGRTYKPSDFVTDRGTFPEKDGIDLTGLADLPPISNAQQNLTYIEAEPGDVIVHHWATIHGSAGNVAAAATRRAASVRYAGDGCRFYQRKSSPEPFRFTIDLEDGDPLEKAERFPVVWPRTG